MQNFNDFFAGLGHISSAIATIAVGWFGYLSSTNKGINQEQYKDLTKSIETIQHTVDEVKMVGQKNAEKIDEVRRHQAVQDTGHLAVLRFRLKKQITEAISREYTTEEEYEIIRKMYESYVSLGGNGLIPALYERYNSIKIK